MVLLQGSIDGRDDALAEGVVERVVDRVGQDAVARGDITLDRDVEHRPGIELIGGYVGDAGNRLDLVEEQRRPVLELAGIGVVQGVLELGLVQARADGDVLRGLHIERDALDLAEVGLQPRDYLVDRVTLVCGLELNVDAAVVHRVAAAAGSHRGSDCVDGWIPHDGILHSLLAFQHGLEGNILRRLGLADNQSGVLLGKETLGNDYVQITGQRDGAEHHHQRDELMPQHDLEACLIEVEHAIEAAFGHAVKPSVLLALGLEQVCAHHRRQRPRDHQRENERHAHRHRKLAEQQSDITAHQEQRNEHGDQRDRDRHDGEADLAGPLHRRIVRRHAILYMACNVLDLDDGVVDHESDRDRQGHQREVVQTKPHSVEHREGADQRQRNGDGRDYGRPEITQEYEDHHHHQRDRQHQRELNVADRCADGLGAIRNDIYLDGGRNRGLEHRQHRLDATHGLDDVGARLTLDRQNDCPLLVEPGGNQFVFSRAHRVADIAYADRRPVAIGDDQVVVFVRLEQLIVGIERIGLARTVERTLGKIDVRLAEHRAHILQVDAASRQRLRVDLYADRRLLLTSDAHEADPGYLRDLLQQNILCVCVDNGQRQAVRGNAEHQDRRLGRVDF